jgi:YXWGXW repeat-containing protein
MRNLIRTLVAVLALAALPVVSQAGLFVGVSVNIAPPVLPVYVQPPCPAPGYIWAPGYWAWDDGYYWVPGTWVLAPAVGLLWTPGYWGWADGVYLWHAGYWGPHVGFYGGINYGFGYTGVGYAGGYWRGSEFYYNRSVTNINTTNITNVYNRTVVNNVNVTHVSFNGGAGGVVARPTPAEISAEHERHLGVTPVQRRQQQLASGNSSLRAAANGGRPAAQHAPVHETAPTRAHAPQHYASVQSNSRGSAFERESRAEEARPAPQYQGRPAPQYQPRPEPQHQARPEPHYQPQPAPHYQPGAAAQGAGRATHETQRPEHGGNPDHGGERNGHG